MGVISGQTAGSNQPFGEPKVIAARNFCNKLWNIARYVESNVGENFKEQPHPVPRTIADHWILSRLQHAEETISVSWTITDSAKLITSYITSSGTILPIGMWSVRRLV